MNEDRVILFDGVCNLCNGAVQFVIKNDPKGKFKFTSLQSQFGQQQLKKYNINFQDFSSFVLIENNKPRLKSTGALYVLKNLRGFFPLLFVLILVPKFIRDWIYDQIAAKRYQWFGKRDQCMVPTPDLQSRFIN
ncbi:thiol-disulfide oxidoreductase DCC family protein [Solitalea lacus]|uniref:thiol-disulfide oxidoreductase DCC family protein n=1 Tax=Solitalea lacus TaxID=2911172 RepID=UPI001EDBC9FC|nr:DCC1-like thiol-disulfide oxidoreductase family protein [Solitalea lacus]UKJ05950.1 DCC1-like thiol-disulfide oxidoreductase family protein [Solitalea lacus]